MLFFLYKVVSFFQTAKIKFFHLNSPKELNGAEMKRNHSLETEMKPTDYKQPTMFVQQYSIFNICERIPRSEQPIY